MATNLKPLVQRRQPSLELFPLTLHPLRVASDLDNQLMWHFKDLERRDYSWESSHEQSLNDLNGDAIQESLLGNLYIKNEYQSIIRIHGI